MSVPSLKVASIGNSCVVFQILLGMMPARALDSTTTNAAPCGGLLDFRASDFELSALRCSRRFVRDNFDFQFHCAGRQFLGKRKAVAPCTGEVRLERGVRKHAERADFLLASVGFLNLHNAADPALLRRLITGD